MTTTEGAALGSWIAHSGVEDLSTVYVTHGHADHFFGATTVLERFPTARLVARPEIADAAADQTSPGYLAVWSSFFPGQITDHPAVPNPMTGDQLTLGSDVISTADVGYSDVPFSSIVHIPDLDTVVSGDVAYNGMHMWLAGSTPATRTSWLQALDSIEALQPATIITGHKDPEAPDDHANRILDQSRQYLLDFQQAAGSWTSPANTCSISSRRPHPASQPPT